MTGLKVVVVGVGANVFPFHRPGLEAIGAEVIGVMDASRDKAVEAADDMNCRAAETLDDLWNLDADLAVILAPHPHHEALTTAALCSGKHVLTEKPIAVTVAEGDRMVAVAAEQQRILAVAFQHRTRTEIAHAHRLIGEGLLGQLQRADVIGTWPRRRTYFDVSPWRGTWEGEGGGVLINQGQHDLDLLCHLAGSPQRVVGWTRSRIHSIETEDSAQAMLEWDNGALGSVHISTAELDIPQRIELTGTSGRLRIINGRLDVTTNAVDFRDFAQSRGDPFEEVPQGSTQHFEGSGGTHVEIYRDLEAAIREGHAPIAPAADAVRTLELANAIIQSSLTDSPVALPIDRSFYADLIAPLRAGEKR